MPILLALIVIICIGLYVLREWRGNRNPCRWVGTGERKGRFTNFKCSVCGAEGMTLTGKAPVDCKRTAKSGGL